MSVLPPPLQISVYHLPALLHALTSAIPITCPPTSQISMRSQSQSHGRVVASPKTQFHLISSTGAVSFHHSDVCVRVSMLC